MLGCGYDSIPQAENELYKSDCDMTETATDTDGIRLEASWKHHLREEFEQPYMQELKRFLQVEKRAGKVIYPPSAAWFNAFSLTPFDQVKVVILGQDPYHGPGQAHGLCFSVPKGVAIPPSLVNIFKELNTDLEVPLSAHGCLESWARQGVLLLNSVMTVERARAGSHQQKGWERFTDRAVQALAEQRDGIVFMLWGSYALKKGQFIDRQRHCVLTAPHPSPLSAYRGFLGCGHFSAANAFLQQRGQTPIDWSLPQ